MFKKLLTLTLFLFYSLPGVYALDDKIDSYILVVYSTNRNEVWTSGLYSGIHAAFSKGAMHVYSEGLQVPMMKTLEEAEAKVNNLRQKYSHPPRLVVFVGDPSWMICRPLFDKEWKDVPTVVCYSQEYIPKDLKTLLSQNFIWNETMIPSESVMKKYNLTTLRQPTYVNETIRLMKRLQPEMKRIAFICDERYISYMNYSEMENVMHMNYPELKLSKLSAPECTTEMLLDTLSSFNKETGIVYFSWLAPQRDGENRYLIDNVQKMTSSFSNYPVFVLSDIGMSAGNFGGGYFISSASYTHAAISTIQEILDGKAARDISTRIGGKPETYLNYQHLSTHNVPVRLFPDDAVYFQRPPGFFEEYRIHLLASVVIFVLLLIVLFLKGRLYIQRQRQREKMEQSLREKEKAEESNRLKSAFLANMSHEIRTPLNAIVGFSNLIASANRSEETEEFCHIIETNNELLLQLVNDILDLSKIEAGQMDFIETDFDLSLAFRELEKVFCVRTKEDVQLISKIPFKSCVVHSEKNRITQVLSNFLSNACKFTSAGTIEFGYERTADGVRCYVTDTGKGISQEQLPRVFERFAKFDSFIQGTGLGLSICEMIIRMLNGRIGVESEVGKGSTFWFTMPCTVLTSE